MLLELRIYFTHTTIYRELQDEGFLNYYFPFTPILFQRFET